MNLRVFLSEDAEKDIEDIYEFVAAQSGTGRAEDLLAALEEVCGSLAGMPERGNVPKELAALGITEFREAHFKPYRIIYHIDGRRVVVFGVFDGRRDMQSLLQRRLVR